jgi:Excalibur calcium-binding domain
MAYRPHKTVSIPLAAAATFVAVYAITPPGRSDASAPPLASAVQTVVSTTYYAGCNEARAAGVAPIYRRQPGYREGMDGDNDGIACEPYRGE